MTAPTEREPSAEGPQDTDDFTFADSPAGKRLWAALGALMYGDLEAPVTVRAGDLHCAIATLDNMEQYARLTASAAPSEPPAAREEPWSDEEKEVAFDAYVTGRRPHDLKTWPEPFQAIRRGDKTHEVRANDREYRVGDLLWLREWNPLPDAVGYTGREEWRRITYITEGGSWGLPSTVCVLSLARLASPPAVSAHTVYCADCEKPITGPPSCAHMHDAPALSERAQEEDMEALAEDVHDAYLTTCARLGWAVKPSNAVPYAELSEDSKELDRASVRAVLARLRAPAPGDEPREGR